MEKNNMVWCKNCFHTHQTLTKCTDVRCKCNMFEYDSHDIIIISKQTTDSQDL